jgi:5-methyltetrahydropteroyltriglutamate--homocysteine methyltransferase
MEPAQRHRETPDAVLEGGELDCGGGLLLLIRQHIDPLPRGRLLEIRSTEPTVDEELPAWCRLTGNDLVSWTRHGRERSFLVCKGALAERAATADDGRSPAKTVAAVAVVAVTVPTRLPAPAPAPEIAALSVTGIGSWPRPRWLVRALHEHLEGRLSEDEFQATADDAVRLAVQAQLRAGVDVVTDGEQRRDSYANFVGSRLDNCRLIPLTDLLPLVDDPEELQQEFRKLDVPAGEVRHPAVLGPLGRSRPIAVHELAFARTLTERPIKVALPGPYVLSRILWMECLSDRAYASREALATDVVRVLREEAHELLAAGASLVQFDEPVLTEVVHSSGRAGPSFMCGALSARGDADRELGFARDLVNAVALGLPAERLAVHVCRGNWTPDESAALTGDYAPLVPLLRSLRVGTCFLEFATPRAGSVELARGLRDDQRVGVGCVNQKHAAVESVDEVLARAKDAVRVLGRDRVLLTPDCGFATFADNPVASADVAERKLAALVAASHRL